MNLSIGSYLPWLMSMAWVVTSKRQDAGGLRQVFGWSVVGFKFPTEEARELALVSGKYKPANCLPLGLDVHQGRLFVTLPRWRQGIPATLASVPLDSPDTSPLLEPFPNWSWHTMGNCNGITSVFRISVDQCGRLWILDSGKIDIVSTVKAVCPPQILVFDLRNDKLLWRYRLPKNQAPQGSLFTNIAVDVREGDCKNAFAYVSDVFRYGLVVYSLSEDKSWRVDHPYFFPDPLTSKYEIDGVKFSWTDGVFGLALSPIDLTSGDRTLFFHSLSSHREFSVPTSFLRNDSSLAPRNDPFRKVGEPRRKTRGHASGSAMDREGILFYNLVSRSAVGCWNSNLKVHNPQTQGIVAKSNKTLSFPNDLKVDNEPEQSIWVLSNKLHKYLYSKLDPFEVNFRVLTSKVQDAIKGTPCEPGFQPPPIRRQRKKCQEL